MQKYLKKSVRLSGIWASNNLRVTSNATKQPKINSIDRPRKPID